MTADLAVARDLSESRWAASFLSVPNEMEQVVKFRYDELQERMAAEATIRDVWVKPRQVRCSSRILARNLRKVTTNFGTHCLTICKDDDMVSRFRYRIQMHLKHLAAHGLAPSVHTDNSEELVFDDLGGSRFIWASAEQAVAGRSFTAHILHASEVAHWGSSAGDILGGILPAIPDPPYGQVDLESTPNGASGIFYNFAMSARYQGSNQDDDYSLHFYHWWEEPKYVVKPTDDEIASFQPSDEERRLMQVHELHIGHILWRRRKIRDMAKTDVPFEQEYPEDLMGCFLLGGNSYFDVDVLKVYMERCSAPILRLHELPLKTGVVRMEGWGEAGPGRPTPWITHGLDIYEQPLPGHDYVMFVDPSEGHKRSDNGAVQVLEAKSRRQVATLALKATPNKLGEMACAIGYHYNGALLAIERNRISAAVLKAVDLDYPNLYYEVDEEDPNKQRRKAGWYTSRENRIRILSNFKEDVEGYVPTIRDSLTVREMFSFDWEQVKKRGEGQWRAQAQEGALDDRVISIAGANSLCDQVVATSSRKTEKTTHKRTVNW